MTASVAVVEEVDDGAKAVLTYAAHSRCISTSEAMVLANCDVGA